MNTPYHPTLRSALSLVLVLAGCASGSDPVPTAECLRDPGCTRVMVAAHRGDHTSLPENSLAALRAAAVLGAELVEVDVWPTSDEQVVLMHSANVDSTTDGSGALADMTWAQVQALTLNGADPDDPETQRVPLFSEALALARELSVMLYVDQKTLRWELVLDDIQAGAYHEQAVVRDSSQTVLEKMKALDERLTVMPTISSGASLAPMMQALPDVTIVELTHHQPWPELCESIIESGLKVQQDVLGYGDDEAEQGDYSAWKEYVDSGVTLLQTDLPQQLVPAIRSFNDSGVFPDAP